MPDDLGDRWASLVEAIRQQCQEHRQDPGLVEANESALKVSLPLNGQACCTVWFSEQQLLRDDLRVLAAFFYREYRLDSGRQRPP